MKYLLFLLLLLVGCKAIPSKIAERREQRDIRKDLRKVEDFKDVMHRRPEWQDTLTKVRIDTVYIEKIVYQTKLQTKVDTVILYQHLDTLSKKLFGTIDDLQSRLLKKSVLDITQKMQLGRMPDTTITFHRKISYEIGGKEYEVGDTVKLDIKSYGKGYVFTIDNQAKRIPVQTVEQKVEVKPTPACPEKSWWKYVETWIAIALMLAITFIRFR